MQYDRISLVRSLQFLVSQQSSSQTAKSNGSASGGTRRSGAKGSQKAEVKRPGVTMSPKDDFGDFEVTPNGVAYDGPPGGLEALLSSRAIVSEPVTVEHDGEKKSVRFRELSNDQKQQIMTFAIQHIEDRRRTQEEDGRGAWRDAESDRDVLIGEERDLRMLQAAMLDPQTNGPACSLQWLRKRMGTGLQKQLGDRYAAFEELIDPEKVNEDLIKLVIDDVKKNTPLDLLLMQYDRISLVRSLQFLVSQQSSSQTAKSNGSASGGTRRTQTETILECFKALIEVIVSIPRL
jgi:hypothetical protein